MRFNWTELFSDLFGKELTEEEKEELEEAMGDAVSSLSFEDVASSVKEDYPNATEEDLRRAITMKEDGYEISYHELPPQPLKKELEGWRDAGIEKVQVLSERSEETCEVCWEADGNVYTIEEALQEMPLPHEECSCDPAALREDGKCNCTYMPKR
jgi:hypothetical protein